MGKRNKERRAAKQRARRRSAGPRAESQGHEHFASAAASSPDKLATALRVAAVEHAKGDPQAREECVSRLAGERFRRHAGAVDRAVDILFRHLIGDAWGAGWLPYDLHQHVRRHLGGRAESLLVDAVAAEAEQYSAATVHPRWREQLRQLDATAWWARDRPHLAQWTERHGRDRDEALGLVIDVAAALLVLPALPRILPPPGTVGSAPGPARHGVDEKVLARVRALLAKAEATSFGEEAEALSAKAQELMNRYALERAVVDAEEGQGSAATAVRLWLDRPYLNAKATLVDTVASANRCRAVFYEKLGFVAVLGDEVDLEIVEMLTTSLLLQATRAMLVAGRDTDAHGRSRTRSYRQSFLLAYATRVGERFREAADDEAAARENPGLLPVLADREKAVDDLFGEMFSKVVPRSYSVSNTAGWGAGRAAADAADLGAERTRVRGG